MIDRTYFDQRMTQMGVAEETNKIFVEDPDAEFPKPSRYETNLFRPDKDGNIEILYYTIDRQLINYNKHNKESRSGEYNGKLIPYTTKRLKEPKGDMKYQMPKGQGTFPWYPPEVCGKFERKERIKILYLTEGAFKARVGAMWGLDVVGLSSITHYADHDGQLHRDIVRLIEVCEVEIVVILWDGDCLNISSKALLRREDLAIRPRGFFNAAKSIQKLIKKIEFEKTRDQPVVYFSHVDPSCFPGRPKGLDDLLIEARESGKAEDVVSHALKLSRKSPYFYRKNIDNNIPQLHAYFCLKNYEQFYGRHGTQIGDTEFHFQGDLIRWNDVKNELELVAPGWAKSLRWIGDEFFAIRLVPGATRERRVLIKRNRETLRDLHGKKFLTYLKFFEGFCNVPSHFNYEQIIEREGREYFNRYFPFRHQAVEGTFNTILGFIKHIFGEVRVKSKLGEELWSWEMGLDYLQMLLLEPTQVLPVLCLYSPENNTGKSTFGKLQKAIFGDNCIQIGNSDLQSDFNEHYADKLLAICEETLLERKKDVERIKALSTSDQISVNPKGQKQYSIDFFCKFQFYSNNKRMIYVTKHDQRFWIIRVPVAKTDNPNLLKMMKAEIPAFIHHVKNRQLATKRTSRMHFHESLIKTGAFYDAVQVNEPGAASDLRENIREMFFQDQDIKRIEMPLKNIKEEFFTPKMSNKFIQEVLTDYLQVDLQRDDDGVAIIKRGHYTKYVTDPEQGIVSRKIPYRGRPYIFHRRDFIEEADEAKYQMDVEGMQTASEVETNEIFGPEKRNS